MVSLLRFAVLAVVVVVGYGVVSASVVSASSGKAPVLEVDGEDLVVRGVGSGAQVLFFAFAHERPAHTLRLLRHEEVLRDSDLDGVVRTAAPRIVGSRAVVAAIEIESGALALARTDDLLGRAALTPGSRVESGVGGDRLVLPGLSQVELVLVRRGVGAWGLRGGDGGGLDESGVPGEQDGSIEARLSTLWSIGESAEPPSALAAGDVLVVLDPHDLAVGAFELGAEGWVVR